MRTKICVEDASEQLVVMSARLSTAANKLLIEIRVAGRVRAHDVRTTEANISLDETDNLKARSLHQRPVDRKYDDR
jgi:hypothetical protein